MQAVILAGGKGTRLRPFTNAIPKPLVPLGDMPILEIVLRQLRAAGVSHVVLAVSHLARLFQAFFEDGANLDLSIEYSMEDVPLGTAAPLARIKNLDENFIVMNGDVLTTIDYQDLFDFHVRSGNALTIATYTRSVKIDLGVLEIENGLLSRYVEKPTYTFDVSMGIYVCNKSSMDMIPPEGHYDMPQFAVDLKQSGRDVGCYKGRYEWLDIGRIDDYEQAVEMFEARRDEFLP